MVKVACFPIPNSPPWSTTRTSRETLEAKRSLPFVVGQAGTYVHRVRSVTLRPERWSAMTWCGQIKHSKNSRLVGEAPEGRTVCGTCQGRAIGAGQIDEGGRPLIFAPVVDHRLGQCCWEHPGGGGYSHPWRCHKHAVEKVDGWLPLCRAHAARWGTVHIPKWRLDEMRRYAERARR